MTEEKKPFDKIAYDNQYIAQHYDRVNLTIPKGEKDRLKTHAESHGESLNEFIKRAISEQICRDNDKQRGIPMKTGKVIRHRTHTVLGKEAIATAYVFMDEGGDEIWVADTMVHFEKGIIYPITRSELI